MEIFVVAVGDLAQGFIFYGPFTNMDLATEWARYNIKVDWHLIPIVPTQIDLRKEK